MLAILWFYAAGHLFAQSSATQLTFEVASVKPSAPDAPGMFIRYLPGGGLRIAGATLQNLISMAYDVRAFQISGGPKWIDNDRFDIVARLTTSDAPHPTLTRQDQSKAAEGLRNLLADRFQLKLHTETMQQPVLALVVAKTGPKLQESTDSESFVRKTGRGSIKGQAVALRLLVLNLANELGRTVVDKTGLTGKYSFELKWDPSIAPDPSEPSLFTALQEQLGLRLESQKGEVKVLVVDRAEKPPAN